MKLKYFIEKPNIELCNGVEITKDTDINYSNEIVEQSIKDLVFKSNIKAEGDTGLNKYESVTKLTITLNEGDILLFNDVKGFYMPVNPVEKIKDAVEELKSIENFDSKEMEV